MGRRCAIDSFRRDNAVVDVIFRHKGKDNAIGTRELVDALNEMGWDERVEQIHTIVGRIVCERRLPICSIAHRGYYWGASKRDIQDAINDLQNKVNGLQERIDLLKSFIIE